MGTFNKETASLIGLTIIMLTLCVWMIYHLIDNPTLGSDTRTVITVWAIITGIGSLLLGFFAYNNDYSDRNKGRNLWSSGNRYSNNNDPRNDPSYYSSL